MDRRNFLIAVAALLAGMPPSGRAAAPAAVDFAGTWRLAMASDGKRSRSDLDEQLELRVVEDLLQIEYRIADRFGTRQFSLRAPLDGTPLEQRAQSRRAVVTARMAGERLVLEIERDAPFGYIRNRRTMQLAKDRSRIDAWRENFKQSGTEHSAWQETWVRVD